MAKVVPEDEYCGLANEKEIDKFSRSNNSSLNLFLIHINQALKKLMRKF